MILDFVWEIIGDIFGRIFEYFVGHKFVTVVTILLFIVIVILIIYKNI